MRPTSLQQPSFNPPAAVKPGDIAFARMEKVNAELVAMTYGAFVSELVRSTSDILQVNSQLELLGYNMGIRLVDEFFAKYGTPTSCQSFKDSVEVLCRVAVKMFLGIDTELSELVPNKSYLISFSENPLNDFVELPGHLTGESIFRYSVIYCGLIRGSFEQLHMKVSCEFLKDMLRGDDLNVIKVNFEGIIHSADDE